MASLTSLRAEGFSDQKYTTENSTYMSRPALRAFLQPDTNSGPTDVVHYTDKTNFLKQHVPTATGQPDFETKCCDNQAVSAVPIGTNQKKVHNMTIMDPITGMISAAGDVYCSSSKKYGLSSFGKARVEPQTTLPQNVNSQRNQDQAINELK